MAWTNWEPVSRNGLEFEEIIYEKRFHTEIEGGVARVSVNRPHRMNATTAHTEDEMFRAFYDASHDPLIGVVVVTGVGDHFGVGGDVAGHEWELREQYYWRYPTDRLVRMSRKPVLAMVKGYCIGGSHHLAYVCDFTIAAENAIFGQNGPRVSSPADGYFVPYLTKVVGAKRAREIWMLCRRYTAHEALEMGLVNAVVAPERLDEEVDKWCEELLELSPGVLEVLKASFDRDVDGYPELGVVSGMLYPDWFDMPEGKEGGRAFLEKRKAEFWAIRKREAEARQKLWAEMGDESHQE
jgi:dihydroxynaphthoic acid synthetase